MVSRLPAAVILAVLVALGCVLRCDGSMELRLVQVVHRHGARSALPPVNYTLICPTYCGYLNHEGKDMLLKQGEYLAARYNGSRPEITPTPFFVPPEFTSETSYNVRHVHSRSTNIARTLQSASALLKGLFPNETEYYPGIHTTELWEDDLLLVNALPAFQVEFLQHSEQYNARLQQDVAHLFPETIVQQMAAETFMEEFCAVPENWSPCVMGIQDVAATRNAEGRLQEMPTIAANYESLGFARWTYNSYLFPYNTSRDLDVQRGSLGQPLAQRMLLNMMDTINQNPNISLPVMPIKKFFHYSAHDTTVMPFCATLGNDNLMLPQFGQMYIIDLLQNTSDGSHHIRTAQSLPGQEPSTNHVVNESVFPLHCMDVDGNVYAVQSIVGTCPFEDFARFIASSEPRSPAGLCYVSPELLHEMECDWTGGAGPPPNSTCYFYRQHCGANACPAGSMLSPVDYSCVALVRDDNSVTDGVAVAAAVASAIGGALVTLLVSLILARRKLAGYAPIAEPAH